MTPPPTFLSRLRASKFCKAVQILALLQLAVLSPLQSIRADDEPPGNPPAESGDADNDQLLDVEESAWSTDPHNPDTDYDGISDADEVRLSGTNPLSPDSDGDGYSDYNEHYGCFKVNTLSHGPWVLPYDFDGDGLYDPVDPDPLSTANDPDTDDDYVPNSGDSDPGNPNLWCDWNRNGVNDDAEWAGWDNDGDLVINGADSDSENPALWCDWDHDGINDDQENSIPTDTDGDSYPDEHDSDPTVPGLWCDWNRNGINDDGELPTDGDGDGQQNLNDSDPANPWLWCDWNHDGVNDDPNNYQDSDNDGYFDSNDSDPVNSGLWCDWNRNGWNDSVDGLDPDQDNVVTGADSHPLDSMLWNDWNNNGVQDENDDNDGDGVNNGPDTHPNDNSLWCDSNGNGVNDDIESGVADRDGDSYPNATDSHPYNLSLWNDWDRNGINDEFQDPPDQDGDGHSDSADSDPENEALWCDWNRNGINDYLEEGGADQDGDNHTDSNDSHPTDPALWDDWNFNGTSDASENPPDQDGDGYPDGNDSHPSNLLLWCDWNLNGANDIDSDFDGHEDSRDSHPNSPSLWDDWNYSGINDSDENILPQDSDYDGFPDFRDSHPISQNLWDDWNLNGINDSQEYSSLDSDNDGHNDSVDTHPYDKNLWCDYNRNGINDGNEQPPPPPDTDGDGYADGNDSHSANPNLWSDWNYNGANDSDESWVGTDTDGDGFDDGIDTDDANSELWADFNRNGFNDDSENLSYQGQTDEDNDGVPNTIDSHPSHSHLWEDWNYDGINDTQADTDGDGYRDFVDTNPLDVGLWNDHNHNGLNDEGEAGGVDSDNDGIIDRLDPNPYDYDNDGLRDVLEAQNYADVMLADTDGDGLKDGDEVYITHTSCNSVDSDADGVSDFEEAQSTLFDVVLRNHPEDTDSDGIPDMVEAIYAPFMNKSNPADAAGDLDADGLTNLQEYQMGTHLSGNSNMLDYDGDGITDLEEDYWAAAQPGILSKYRFGDAFEDGDGDGLMSFEEVRVIKVARSPAPGSPPDSPRTAYYLKLNPASAYSTQPTVKQVTQYTSAGVPTALTTPYPTTNPKKWNVPDGELYFWFIKMTIGSSKASSVNLADVNQNRIPDGYDTVIQALGDKLKIPPCGTDIDFDGLTNIWEGMYRFDPRNSGDGKYYRGFVPVFPLLRPEDAESAESWNQHYLNDPDHDGLCNYWESVLKTHPRISDSDHDGIADGVEYAYQTNPLSNTSTPVFQPGITPPTHPNDVDDVDLPNVDPPIPPRPRVSLPNDLDGDGVSADDEIAQGTSDQVVDSDGDGYTDYDDAVPYDRAFALQRTPMSKLIPIDMGVVPDSAISSLMIADDGSCFWQSDQAEFTVAAPGREAHTFSSYDPLATVDAQQVKPCAIGNKGVLFGTTGIRYGDSLQGVGIVWNLGGNVTNDASYVYPPTHPLGNFNAPTYFLPGPGKVAAMGMELRMLPAPTYVALQSQPDQYGFYTHTNRHSDVLLEVFQGLSQVRIHEVQDGLHPVAFLPPSRTTSWLPYLPEDRDWIDEGEAGYYDSTNLVYQGGIVKQTESMKVQTWAYEHSIDMSERKIIWYHKYRAKTAYTYQRSLSLVPGGISYSIDRDANDLWAGPTVKIAGVSDTPPQGVPMVAGQKQILAPGCQSPDPYMLHEWDVEEENRPVLVPDGAVVWTRHLQRWNPIYDHGGPGKSRLIRIQSINSKAMALVGEDADHNEPFKLWANGKVQDVEELLGTSSTFDWSTLELRKTTSSGSIIALAKHAVSGRFHVVTLLPLEVVSDQAENNGRYDINKHDETLYPRPGNVLAANTSKALENALHLYFHDCAEDNRVTPGSITARSWTKFTLKIDSAPIQGLGWQVVEKPPGSPDLTTNDPSRLIRYISNLNGNMRGGLYRFKLAGVQGVEPQVWLPLAGPDIAEFWDAEVDYFHNTWGPAYRAKLAKLTDGYPATHASFVQAQNAFGDMHRLGGTLDWQNPPGGPPRGTYSPCSGPNAGTFRYTVHGVVVTNWMLNNMMYALIGREMTIRRGVLIAAGDSGLNPSATGDPDDEYTWEAYRIGFYLFEGGSLQDLFHQYGRNMQRPDSWESREWPSWETSNAKLIRSQAQMLQDLIQ